jgi:hypothetical protein
MNYKVSKFDKLFYTWKLRHHADIHILFDVINKILSLQNKNGVNIYKFSILNTYCCFEDIEKNIIISKCDFKDNNLFLKDHNTRFSLFICVLNFIYYYNSTNLASRI